MLSNFVSEPTQWDRSSSKPTSTTTVKEKMLFFSLTPTKKYSVHRTEDDRNYFIM